MATDRSISRDPPSIGLEKVDCIGTEDDITQCPQDDSHQCINVGAGVICPPGEVIAKFLKL